MINSITIPNLILYNRQLSDKEKLLSGLISCCQAHGNGSLHVSNKDLAAVLNTSEDHVTNILRKLRAKLPLRILNPQSRYRKIRFCSFWLSYSGISLGVDVNSTPASGCATPSARCATPSESSDITKQNKKELNRKDMSDAYRLTEIITQKQAQGWVR